MTPGEMRVRVIAERAAWIREMLAGLRSIDLASLDTFRAQPLSAPAAESYLRRALEALLDLGRHVLAKGFGRPPGEYKEIADELADVRILSEQQGRKLREMAGYRNRLVHFYDAVGEEELYEICTARLGDVEEVLEAILAWVRDHPEHLDRPLPE